MFCSNLIGVDWRLVMLLGLMKIDLLFLFSAFYLRHSRRRLQCRRSHHQQDNRVWCVTIALWFIAQLNTTWSIDDKSIALGRRCRQDRKYTERRGAGRWWWWWWSAAGGSTPRAYQVSNIVFRKSNHIILRTSVWIVGAHTRTPARTYALVDWVEWGVGRERNLSGSLQHWKIIKWRNEIQGQTVRKLVQLLEELLVHISFNDCKGTNISKTEFVQFP